ncbi:MAG TPA: DNA-binding protein YbiB [Methylibium sp.]|uniref:DNA-binding protein YbiB n=1 Tax=Methylibium sp. TaxID=2067992 RepID=UPI002DB8E8FF|nr:DNA-binding protein YbiB [Methylibium sp.]HEU4459876.1 DNA-binding protein YbiB [Methylibium sp.]
MGIAKYLKEIGRGKEGARNLDEAQARDLFEQALDGKLTQAELGAFAIGMRIKGESLEELAGFTAVAIERSLALDPRITPILLPSYNGARKLPNLSALLALLLAQQGLPVLVHGPTSDPTRVTTHELFSVLGLPVTREADGVHDAWARHEPVFVPTEAMCPALAPLLALRWELGLRNPAHTVAKLLVPRSSEGGRHALRVVNYTHPEYAASHAHFLAHTKANALLMRGTEGEPVADARRLPRLDAYVDGVLRPELGRAPAEGVLTELPLLPRTFDAPTTALAIQAMVSGEKPVPAPIAEQVEVLKRMHAVVEAARRPRGKLA